jgi:hypothetical protein
MGPENCNLGVLPHLGIPIPDGHLVILAFMGIPSKMFKRLDPWKRETNVF